MKCLFCEFIKGKKTHTKDNEFVKNKPLYKLISVFENKDVFSFLSIPDNMGETHLLVIPREHYEFIEDIPEESLKEIFHIVTKMTGILRKNYGDCHILINNGKNAEQYIKHVHFHIIPKTHKKQPKWHNLSHKKFQEISEDLTKLFQNIH
jgi:diadenosine tetraphosphate (Ap4A) HIT family hydrolase